MKRIILLLVLGTVCGSCQKIIDYFRPHSDNDPSTCQVTQIENYDEGTVSGVTTINYHENGLPESVVSEFTFDGNQFSVFDPYIYDSQGRLLEEGAFSTESPVKRVYAYEGDSRLPVRDTLFAIAHVFLEEFEYDGNGRIIRVYTRNIYNPDEGEVDIPDEELRYYYDLRGNRQEHPSNPRYPGIIKYSDKPSLYSLHAVWQIQHRDFSRNSALNGETFNDSGLPLSLKPTGGDYFQPFLDMNPGAKITYACD